MCVCGWLDPYNFVADIMVISPELFMSSVFESFTCSVDSSWVGADGS